MGRKIDFGIAEDHNANNFKTLLHGKINDGSELHGHLIAILTIQNKIRQHRFDISKHRHIQYY
jgi:hypothetical protein